jgi:nucleoid-associated protein YgaU
MGRYNKDKILTNASEYYRHLREKRGVKVIRQYETPRLRNPTLKQRQKTKSTKHIWKYGDRLYKLADQYYGSSRYWWVIAWYNGVATEADLKLGQLIRIPLNLENAMKVLGV